MDDKVSGSLSEPRRQNELSGGKVGITSTNSLTTHQLVYKKPLSGELKAQGKEG